MKIKRFQAGGQAPAAPEGGAPAGESGSVDLESMIAQYAQSRDPQLAVAICDAIVELMAQQQGQGGAPAGAAPAATPAPAAKKGMKLKRGPVFHK